MTKHHFKRYLILICLICFTFHSSHFFAQNITTVDTNTVIEESYGSLNNIHKQMLNIIENYFISNISTTTSKPDPGYLDIYISQLNAIGDKIKAIDQSKVTLEQKTKLRILRDATDDLTYISGTLKRLLTSLDAKEQYNLFRAILYASNLVEKDFSYF